MPSGGIEFSSFRTLVSDHRRRTSEGLAYLPVFSRGVPRLTFPRAPAMFTPGRLRWRGKLHKMRVILADDHPNFPEIAERVLQPQFKVVAKVADGQRLFDEAMRLEPDLIVTDISMPVSNGIAAAERLRQSGCKSRIVFLTVHTDCELVERCLSAGAQAYVIKSRIGDELILAIQEALAGRIFISQDVAFRHPA